MTAKNNNPNQFSFSGNSGVPEKVWDTKKRNKNLFKAGTYYTEAGKRAGATYITEYHPKYNQLDNEYDIDNLKRKYELFIRLGDEAILDACGSCQIEGCPIRNKPEIWREKYPKSIQRNKFLKKLSKNPTEQC
jgi:hypothetical protein